MNSFNTKTQIDKAQQFNRDGIDFALGRSVNKYKLETKENSEKLE